MAYCKNKDFSIGSPFYMMVNTQIVRLCAVKTKKVFYPADSWYQNDYWDDDYCTGCYFTKGNHGDCHSKVYCKAKDRKDGKNVIYVKVK
jgi:hypothetical protein